MAEDEPSVRTGYVEEYGREGRGQEVEWGHASRHAAGHVGHFSIDLHGPLMVGSGASSGCVSFTDGDGCAGQQAQSLTKDVEVTCEATG